LFKIRLFDSYSDYGAKKSGLKAKLIEFRVTILNTSQTPWSIIRLEENTSSGGQDIYGLSKVHALLMTFSH
jgi:hypothetical protein